MTDRRETRPSAWDDTPDEAAEEDIKALTREEVQALVSKHPPMSPWRVVAVQAAIGAVVVALTWLLTEGQGFVWSALYGAATVVFPSALMARGVGRQAPGMKAGAYVVSFMLWEFGKIALSVAMLALAPKLVPDLSWTALLVSLVLGLKASWLALLMQRWSR